MSLRVDFSRFINMNPLNINFLVYINLNYQKALPLVQDSWILELESLNNDQGPCALLPISTVHSCLLFIEGRVAGSMMLST